MEEIHHTQKLDAPSGTTISLAEGVINLYTNWTLENQGNRRRQRTGEQNSNRSKE
jgi:4-hydroxy-tetrahydrodipicolinate reductase